MEIIEVSSGVRKAVIIRKAEEEDIKLLVKKRFSFIWKNYKDSTEIFLLQLKGLEDILGAISLIDCPQESRIEIKLLASSKENIGKYKIYEGIAGCLIAFACRRAVAKYGIYACVSLVPKTALINHYMKMYFMKYAGWQLYIDGNSLNKIFRKYL